MSKLEKFAINPTNEFHVLRHFEFVDEAYTKTLINKPYWYYDYAQKKYLAAHISQKDIDYALETIGTKFYRNIEGIENPRKLLKLIQKKFVALSLKNEIKWINEGERNIFAFTFAYAMDVGDMNCLTINKLTDSDKKNIQAISRSECVGEEGVVVDTISGIELLATNRIYVEIVETKQLPFFAITAFPDCSANNNLSDDELVFVV